MSLVALGATGMQNRIVNYNPMATMWKAGFRPVTHFSMGIQELFPNSSLSYGSTVTFNITRNADMLWKLVLQVTLSACAAASNSEYASIERVNGAAWAMIRSVELKIGGSCIDEIYGEYLHIWAELSDNEGRTQFASDFTGYYNTDAERVAASAAQQIYHVPLPFWFTYSPGLALPLVAMQYHEVKLEVNLQTKDYVTITRDANGDQNSVTSNQIQGNDISQMILLATYIFLDAEERTAMVARPHLYLSTHHQHESDTFTSSTSANQNVTLRRMNLNHILKEINFVLRPNERVNGNTANNVEGKDYFNYSYPGPNPGDNVEPLVTSQLRFNNNNCGTSLAARYLRLVQHHHYHSRIPDQYIYTFPFAVYPEEPVQPTGGTNASRIDTISLDYTAATNTNGNANDLGGRLLAYAKNWNVSRVQSGMFGLAYSD